MKLLLHLFKVAIFIPIALATCAKPFNPSSFTVMSHSYDVFNVTFEMSEIPKGVLLVYPPNLTAKIKREIPAFNIMQTEVTFALWDACVNDKACKHNPSDEGWGRGSRPVINVSYNDITQDFILWLNQQAGLYFALPTKQQWEYAARAGSATDYFWGNKASHEYANYGSDECCDGKVIGKGLWLNTAPVKSFVANKFGLYDMHGNVLEWTSSCFNQQRTIAGDPSNTSCEGYEMRGGSWFGIPALLASSQSFGIAVKPTARGDFSGFRLVTLF